MDEIKKSANLRESRSLRSLSESRALFVDRRPFGSAWLIAIATAHAEREERYEFLHELTISTWIFLPTGYCPACAVAVAISHADPKGRRATQSARDSLSDRRERDSRRFVDFFSHPAH